MALASGPTGAVQLRVDRDHPFFFDHPLDHVPGLLLLEGAVQLAQRDATQAQFVSRISARFIRYALFETPIQLTRETFPTERGQKYRIGIDQAGQPRARIEVDMSNFTMSARTVSREAKALSPCPRQALNKLRAENVLIAMPDLDPPRISARLLPPPSDCLLTDSLEALHPLYLLESFMQLQRYLNSQSPDAGRMRDILTGIEFRQEAPVTDRDAALTLSGPMDFVEGPRNHYTRSADISSGKDVFAWCSIETARAGGARTPA